MLKYRILSAIILIPLIILAVYKLPLIGFSYILLFILALAAWEWASLADIKHRVLKACYVVVFLLAVYATHRFLSVAAILWLGLGFFIYLWLGLVVYQAGATLWGLNCKWMRMLLGIVILSSSLVAMLVVLAPFFEPGIGRSLFMYSLLLVWLTDSAAYFGGRLWGKNALASRVSPKKTWEGFWSGIVFALIFALIISGWAPLTGVERYYWWLISLLMVVVSVLGDLSISVLKRIADVKDSGQLIPGHGGILDRVDSLLPAFMVASIALVMWVSK